MNKSEARPLEGITSRQVDLLIRTCSAPNERGRSKLSAGREVREEEASPRTHQKEAVLVSSAHSMALGTSREKGEEER